MRLALVALSCLLLAVPLAAELLRFDNAEEWFRRAVATAKASSGMPKGRRSRAHQETVGAGSSATACKTRALKPKGASTGPWRLSIALT